MLKRLSLLLTWKPDWDESHVLASLDSDTLGDSLSTLIAAGAGNIKPRTEITFEPFKS